MHVLLVGAELEENLALRYLAAALDRAGHTSELVTFDGPQHEDAVVAAVVRAKPGLVGMSSTFQFRAKQFGELAGAVRATGFSGHITVGGHFPTFAYREMLETFPAIDSVVRHEGEITIVEMCRALERVTSLAEIAGLAFRGADGAPIANAARPMIEDLDGLPFPKRVGEPQLHMGIPAAFMVGTRGCYGHCTFCCIHAYLKAAGGPMYRARSPENVADEMWELRKTRGARMFVFHDDDFFTRDHEHDLARMIALRDALKKRGLTDIGVVVKARPDDVDARVFAVLQEIGLLRVYLGIEAGSTQGLRTLGRGVDLQENHRALGFLREKDVYTCFNMLVFDPESRLESLRESFNFLRSCTTTPMNFCRTEIYVGTPLMTKLAREGRLIGDVFGWDYVIREPRAERAFRVFASAFLDRNFRCDGLMNSTLGLGYHLHLLRQFYPQALIPGLREQTDETVRAVNLDCIERMERIFDFADTAAAADPHAHEDFTGKMTLEVEAANRVLEDRVAATTDAIIRAAFATARDKNTQSAQPRRAVSAWQALSAAAALTIGPLAACDRPFSPPPPDPLPVPTLVVGPDGAEPINTALPPPDPPPPPVTFDAGSAKKDAGRPPPPPPPDPLPRPTVHPMPPDPLPRPTLKHPPPPDPPPPPFTK
jgi:radical SAM superfamily enzyme YgiQ (UPF0313 family)